MSDDLRSLMAWYRSLWEDEIPIKLHSHQNDAGGAKDWHGTFRLWLQAPPDATFRDDGEIISPLKWWLNQMAISGRRGARRAKYLGLLAACDFDWNKAGHIWDPLAEPDMVEAYTYITLLRFQRVCSKEPKVYTRKWTELSESQQNAETRPSQGS